eukprot:Tamp_34250.p2 GENE.Tamp_34250~~Tamp_34250.p2  ORF type:complete len:135 (-),score=13.58 Tamp_34250:30-434(-)
MCSMHLYVQCVHMLASVCTRTNAYACECVDAHESRAEQHAHMYADSHVRGIPCTCMNKYVYVHVCAARFMRMHVRVCTCACAQVAAAYTCVYMRMRTSCSGMHVCVNAHAHKLQRHIRVCTCACAQVAAACTCV